MSDAFQPNLDFNAEEVEELLRSAHAEAIREDVRKRSRQILREAFDGKLEDGQRSGQETGCGHAKALADRLLPINQHFLNCCIRQR